jgi:hypothetical protein
VLAVAAPADYSCMRQSSQITDRFSAEWLAGYRAALADLDEALASVGGGSLTPFVRARLMAQLLQRGAAPRAA